MYIDHRRQLSLMAAFAAVLIVMAVGAPAFFTMSNAQDIVLNSSTLAIAALGMTLVIVAGQIDISVGAILAICSTLSGAAAAAGLPPLLVIVVAIGCGASLGALNGILTSLFRVHSIVVTLGTLSIYRGALLYVTQGSWLYELPQSFLNIGQGYILGIPNPIIAVLIVYAGGVGLVTWTRWGRAVYAVGSNAEAARLSGISVARTQLMAFAVSGGLVGLAALLQASRFNVIQGNAGVGFEFPVITAVVVGGTSIFGGAGSLAGTLIGALFVTTVSTGLVFLHVGSMWEQAVQGVLLLPAAMLDGARLWRLRRNRAARAEAGAST